MNPPRYLSLILIAPLLAASWLALVLLEPSGPPRLSEYLIVGHLFGAFFGQTTMAAAWMAFGPLPLRWRLPLSLAWVAILPIALGLNMAMHSHGPDSEVAVVLGLCVFGQWALVQAPLWALTLGYGLRMRHHSDPQEASASERQFGIRQLLIVTAIVAVLLGIGRAVVWRYREQFEGISPDGLVFVFLAVAGILMTMPLLIAALLPRYSLWATGAVLILIGAATAWELPLLQAIMPQSVSGADMWIFVMINAFQAGWILAIIGLLRLGGYRLSDGSQIDAGTNLFAKL